MFCPECGAEISQRDKFCRECGEMVSNNKNYYSRETRESKPINPSTLLFVFIGLIIIICTIPIIAKVYPSNLNKPTSSEVIVPKQTLGIDSKKDWYNEAVEMYNGFEERRSQKKIQDSLNDIQRKLDR